MMFDPPHASPLFYYWALGTWPGRIISSIGSPQCSSNPQIAGSLKNKEAFLVHNPLPTSLKEKSASHANTNPDSHSSNFHPSFITLSRADTLFYQP